MDTSPTQQTSTAPFSGALDITPTARWPVRLPPATVEAVMARPVPAFPSVPVGRPGASSPGRSSIILITFDNLVFTRLCLETALFNTAPLNYEIIVVDNGSTDGTEDYLRALARNCAHIRLIVNASNRGFAPAVNQGLAAAGGDSLILLNNDTMLPPQWLSGLVGHLRNRQIGLIGPVTNRAGNAAQIEVPYRTYAEFLEFAQAHAQEHRDELFDIPILNMFCTAMRRDVYERVGMLDERFEVGMFEDHDFAIRTRALGYRVVCAEDIFVHHFGQASIGKLASTEEYGKVFHANRRRFEEKWRIRWEPDHRRRGTRYEQLVARMREAVRLVVPVHSTVAVVSRGDEELLRLGGPRAWHFPQTDEGVYAGYHPADSADAIHRLEALRAKGAQFLIFPATAFWWFEHYTDFKRYLERTYRMVVRQEDTLVVFELQQPRGEHAGGG